MLAAATAALVPQLVDQHHAVVVVVQAAIQETVAPAGSHNKLQVSMGLVVAVVVVVVVEAVTLPVAVAELGY
jgi:hypothetical protein